MKFFTAILKLLGGALIYVLARTLAGIIWPFSPGFAAVPENETWLILPAFLLVGLAFSAIMRFYASHSLEKTWLLVLKTCVVFFLINTLQVQVETLYFLEAFPIITASDMLGVFVMGIISTILFVPACICMYRAGSAVKGADHVLRDYSLTKVWWRYALVVLAYVVLYFSFGLLAQLFPALKAEYAEWIINDTLLALLPLWQVARGILFCAIAVLLFIIFPVRSKALLGAVLSFTLFISLELLFPNNLMSPTLRVIHFFEINGSMALYALVAGSLVLKKRPAR